jgi:hypothetical protein
MPHAHDLAPVCSFYRVILPVGVQCAMGMADYLVKNHAAIARVVFPVAVGFGFIYTVKMGRTPFEDASSVARGTKPCWAFIVAFGVVQVKGRCLLVGCWSRLLFLLYVYFEWYLLHIFFRGSPPCRCR